MLTKIILTLAGVLAVIVAAILFALGVREVRSSQRGLLGGFLGLVGILLTLWSPRPAAADVSLRGTSLALAQLLVAEDTDWASTSEWKAVIAFWDASEILEEKGRAASQADIEALRADSEKILADLEVLAGKGGMPAATLGATRAIIDRQVWHINRQRATCYKPASIGHRRLNNLARRITLLEQLREGGKIDAWLYERAMDGFTVDTDPSVPDMDSRKLIIERSKIAMEHALVVQRLLDERRLSRFLISPEWKAMRADLAPMFGGETLPEAVTAGLNSALQPQVAVGNLSEAALDHLGHLLGLSGHNKLFKRILGSISKDDASTRKENLNALASLAFDGWARERGVPAADDPALLLEISEVYDLLRSLAPVR